MGLTIDQRIYKTLAAGVYPFTESTELYGALVTMKLTTLSDVPQLDVDRGHEHAEVTDALSVLKQTQLTVTHHGFSTAVLAVLQGWSYDETGSPVDSRASRAHAGEDKPYFALGLVLALSGNKSEIRYYPRCKLMGDSGMSLSETNQWVRPQLNIDSLVWNKSDGTKYDVYYREEVAGVGALGADLQVAVDALRTRTTT